MAPYKMFTANESEWFHLDGVKLIFGTSTQADPTLAFVPLRFRVWEPNEEHILHEWTVEVSRIISASAIAAVFTRYVVVF